MRKPKFKVHPDLKKVVDKYIAPKFTKEQRQLLDECARFLRDRLKVDE